MKLIHFIILNEVSADLRSNFLKEVLLSNAKTRMFADMFSVQITS